MKRTLLILALLLLLLLAAVAAGWWWLTTTRGGAQWALSRAAGFVETLEWSRLEGGLAGGIVLHDVRMRHQGTQFGARRVELAARVRPLPSPSVRVHWLRGFDMELVLPGPDEDAPEPEPLVLPEDLSSPVPVRLDELLVRNFRIRTSGVACDTQVGAKSPSYRVDSQPAGGALQRRREGEGGFAEGKEALAWSRRASRQDIARDDVECGILIDHLRLSAQFDDRLIVENLSAEAKEWTLGGEIDAGMTAPWPLEARLEVSGRMPIPPSAREGGSFGFTLTASGRLDEVTVDLQTAGLIEASMQGRVLGLPEVPSFDATITSRHFAWPEIPVTASAVEMQLSGHPGDWRLSAEFDAEWTMTAGDNHCGRGLLAPTTDDPSRRPWEGPPTESCDSRQITSRWQLSASGDMEHANLSESRIDVLGGTVMLDAGARWAGPLTASADVRFQHLDFTPLYPDWPDQVPVSGRVSGGYGEGLIDIDALELSAPPSPLSITGTARIDAEADSVSADIQWQDLAWPPVADDSQQLLFHSRRGSLKADGKLSDWRVELEAVLKSGPMPEGTLDATVSGDDSQFIVEGLALNIGDNRLLASSTQGLNIEYQLDAENLEQLWPDLGGQLALSGHVNPDGPAWSASGTGTNLAWQDYRLAGLSLESAGTFAAENSRLDTHITLDTLDLSPWERIERLELITEGRCEDHRITLEADADQANLRLEGSAGLDACPPDFGAWQAQWSRLELLDTIVGDWTMPAPASSRVSARDGTMLEDLCLESADDPDARLCVPRFLLENGSGTLTASLANLPADLLLGLSDTGVRLSSELDGEFNAAWRDDSLESVAGQLDIGRGWLRQQGATGGLRIESGTVQLRDDGPNNLNADVQIDVEGDSQLQATFQLAGLQPVEQATLTGTARAQVPDLSAYSRLAPELDRLEGSLAADLNIGGRLLSPDLTGRLQLQEGRVESVPLGLILTAINLDAETANGGLSLAGGFNAGDGRAELTGTVAPENGAWLVNTQVRGQDLQLFDSDWMQLRVSPDFSFDMSGERIAIDGRIDIPYARLGLPPGSEDRIQASSDVVILGAPEPEQESAPPIPLTGTLTIGVGDDVRFRGAGARADLAGEIELRWREGPPMPRARGSIQLTDGHYQAYGQNLNFTESEVRFAGRRVDDPILDIRAVREIFADPVVEAAGVHIRGTARNPIIDLFTDPETNEEKALAYIVTGADFDHASGQGAFNVGFYLMPNLFVSYGIGLFETGNVLSASYHLSRRWGLRATSGERDTGVDLSYVIDR